MNLTVYETVYEIISHKALQLGRMEYYIHSIY